MPPISEGLTFENEPLPQAPAQTTPLSDAEKAEYQSDEAIKEGLRNVDTRSFLEAGLEHGTDIPTKSFEGYSFDQLRDVDVSTLRPQEAESYTARMRATDPSWQQHEQSRKDREAQAQQQRTQVEQDYVELELRRHEERLYDATDETAATAETFSALAARIGPDVAAVEMFRHLSEQAGLDQFDPSDPDEGEQLDQAEQEIQATVDQARARFEHQRSVDRQIADLSGREREATAELENRMRETLRFGADYDIDPAQLPQVVMGIRAELSGAGIDPDRFEPDQLGTVYREVIETRRFLAEKAKQVEFRKRLWNEKTGDVSSGLTGPGIEPPPEPDWDTLAVTLSDDDIATIQARAARGPQTRRKGQWTAAERAAIKQGLRDEPISNNVLSGLEATDPKTGRTLKGSKALAVTFDPIAEEREQRKRNAAGGIPRLGG